MINQANEDTADSDRKFSRKNSSTGSDKTSENSALI
jgi:hypothetical protein